MMGHPMGKQIGHYRRVHPARVRQFGPSIMLSRQVTLQSEKLDLICGESARVLVFNLCLPLLFELT